MSRPGFVTAEKLNSNWANVSGVVGTAGFVADLGVETLVVFEL